MLGNLRRYEVQAAYAVGLAAVSVLPGLAGVWLAASRYNGTLGRIIYGEHGRFVPALLACVAVSLGAASLGFVLGWNSAGQRRNHRSRLSWTGFFLGGTMATLNVIVLLAFYMLRLRN